VVLQQFIARGLYPALDAPVLQVNGALSQGGAIAVGDVLSLVASNAVYYTLDGSDPRQFGTGRRWGCCMGRRCR